MPRLFDRFFTRAELSRRGDLSQFGGVRLGQLGDGFERGARVADVRTGSGFDFTVLIDRDMDLGAASFCGAPLAWHSPTTFAHPAYFEPEGLGWLRGFGGGLMATGGLTYFGAPTIDQGEPLGLHGRASHIPATHVAYGADWHEDECELWVSGEVREAAVFGSNLVLRRRISARLGKARLTIEDSVTNEGFAPAPLMLLYHCNLGFPVLSEDSEVLVASAQVWPRDQAAEPGFAEHRRFGPPTSNYAEQVFYHAPHVDPAGYAQAALVNRKFGAGRGLGVALRWRASNLPWMFEWKMIGEGHYVCGLEPATNLAGGRDQERAQGRLRQLMPGESERYCVEISVLASQAQIEAFENSVDSFGRLQ